FTKCKQPETIAATPAGNVGAVVCAEVIAILVASGACVERGRRAPPRPADECVRGIPFASTSSESHCPRPTYAGSDDSPDPPKGARKSEAPLYSGEGSREGNRESEEGVMKRSFCCPLVGLVVLGVCAGLAAPAPAGPVSTTLYYTTFAGGQNVNRTDF